MPFGSATPDTPQGMPAGEHEVIYVDERVVACDGGNAGLGHPRVWLRIVNDQTFCPYCSRIYAINPGATEGGH